MMPKFRRRSTSFRRRLSVVGSCCSISPFSLGSSASKEGEAFSTVPALCTVPADDRTEQDITGHFSRSFFGRFKSFENMDTGPGIRYHRSKKVDMKTYKYIKNSALFFALVICVLLLSCSSSDVIRTARIAVTGDGAAAGRLAAEKAAAYAVHPGRIGEDLRRVKDLIDRFRSRVGGVWGSDDAREPSSHEYV
ncbi:MAG TPA: DUF3393 domain-containing protein, partial [Deltaproteobacteria bacterium]|nr:DUF3393 domain-containing protein [Deltaproteobacteria bacterium]